MILFTLLAITLAMLVTITLLTISLGGSVFIILFSDVIVCIAIIVWFIKRLANKKKK